ncbi:hypothetical protein [Martelella endophytica]|uniref:Tail assembly chaperone E/41/14-like protein n=1 Tax=Martelella endophytica TaxID=1486262 RepID=A0A0D5LRC8_MAREN|nr:hypothetical protein [Martelella endophytica]AJY46480.1 hypothetical protein TM49_13605 [Martelella endophytica]
MTTKTIAAIDLDDEETVVDETIVDEDTGVSVQKADDDIVDEDATDPLDKLPSHAIRNADGTITLPLYETVRIKVRASGKIKEKVFESLTFHRLTGLDTRVISEAPDNLQNIVTFARSCRLNQAVMNAVWDKLDATDIAGGGRVLNHFLTSGPKTRAS